MYFGFDMAPRSNQLLQPMVSPTVWETEKVGKQWLMELTEKRPSSTWYRAGSHILRVM